MMAVMFLHPMWVIFLDIQDQLQVVVENSTREATKKKASELLKATQ